MSRPSTRHKRRYAVACVGVLFAIVVVASAVAGPSPGISPARITIEDPLRQGDDVRLPSFGVTNQGDEPGAFTMELFAVADQNELAPDAEWFRFDPQTFELAPGTGQSVSVRLTVPRDAEPGEYRALLRARAGRLEGATTAVSVAAAVAATLRFTVENRNFHFYDPVTDFFSDRAPFSYIGVGLLLALLAAYLIRRRLRFRISFGVERRE